MPNVVYKIRDRITGLYSLGGVDPRWGKRGKVWNGIGPLKCHLRQYVETYAYGRDDSRRRKIPDTWEVVVFAVAEPAQADSPKPAAEFYNG